MLKFTLIDAAQTNRKYRYYPEGGAVYGIVSFEEGTGEAEIVKLAENDQHGIYAAKMFSRLRKMARTGEYEKTGMIAWY